MLELLTTEQMSRADALTIEEGTPGMELMENAGFAVAEAFSGCCPNAKRVVVLCGPGNNGGDGFVAARYLLDRGLSVRLALVGSVDDLKGDAAEMAALWNQPVLPFTPDILDKADAVIDAIFGAGLTRDVEGEVARMIGAVNAAKSPVIAVDVPSGVDGTSGQIRGLAVEALCTVTFFRRKPGHVLLPGRLHCGTVKVADIGIEPTVLEDIQPRCWVNDPMLWRDRLYEPQLQDHKYRKGHMLVVAGDALHTGAARLAARSALRVGAGLVTVAGNKKAARVMATQLTTVMLAKAKDAREISRLLGDVRKNTALIGPASGTGRSARAKVMAVLSSPAACVLDADALTVFADDVETLKAAIAGRDAPVVLTPHEGEFNRLFKPSHKSAKTKSVSKLETTRKAAAEMGCVVVHKGADTVIAAPDGNGVINDNAPPWLATAGTGDVLAGIVAGFLTQGMPAFAAACAAVWLHGTAGRDAGFGMIAEDLPDLLPGQLKTLIPAYSPD